MKAIIFGVKGQDGYYLSELLIRQGIEIIGIDRSEKSEPSIITNFERVRDLVRQCKPDYIFHFAANSTTRHEAWEENHDTISSGTLNILEAVKLESPNTKVFLSGSGLQFRNEGKPIKESDPFEATSMYAVSRIHTVFAARYYRSLGLKIYVGYFFNHDSPLRTERHINKRITATVNRIVGGSHELLEIGNMEVRKEYGFAGDIVQAVWIMVQQEKVFEAVIGTGKAYSIREWIETCFSLKSLYWQDYIKTTEGFTPEYEVLVSDPKTIFSLGWQPKLSMQELASMMIN